MYQSRCILLVGVFLLFSSSSAIAFEFNGTALDTSSTALNNTLVNITIRDMAGFSVVGYNSTYSNATGWFSMNVTENPSWMYEAQIIHFNGTFPDYIGQALPAFPSEVLAQISGISFYLKDAGTINLTAVNMSGSEISFNYQIKDKKLGYIVADSMSEGGEGATNAVVYVPRDRNYSIMIFPNAECVLATADWTNFSSASSYTFSDGLSSYNATTYVLHKQFNMTMGHGRVSGYITVPGISSWDEFTVVPYLIEPGDMVHSDHGALPYNLSAFFENNSDLYNLSTGLENQLGFYNISLPSTVELSEMLLFAVARNGSTYYGGFNNLSLDYSTYTSGQALELNFTSLFGLLGDPGNISLEHVSGPTNKNISASLQTFTLINETDNSSLSNVFAHIESTMDYTVYGVKEFTWMADVQQGASASLSLPLLNSTGIEEMRVFVSGGDFAPKRTEWSVSQIVTNSNISIGTFNPRDINGQSTLNEITISLYTSNATCDVPNPADSCSLESSQNMVAFNPLRAIMGGGSISFRMGVGGILIHYVNVDMLASGPPDALFEDPDTVTESTSGSFGKAARFGSGGPTIYDFVLVSIPYTEGSSSTTGLNETEAINLSLPALYDEDWNVIWNTTLNGTNATYLSGNFSHYAEYASDWEVLLEGVTCTAATSAFNATTPCYLDSTNNRVWVRLPHFSGTSPTVSGQVVTADVEEESSSGGGSSSSGGSVSATTNLSYRTLDSGYGVSLREKYNVLFKVNTTIHNLTVDSIGNSSVTITVRSTPQTKTLAVNETWKVELTGDSLYDLSVRLESVSSVFARLILTTISEEIPPENISAQSSSNTTSSSSPEETDTPEEESSFFFWIIILIAILFVASVGTSIYIRYMKRKS